MTSIALAQPLPIVRTVSVPTQLEAAAELIMSARRPLFWAGSCVVAADAAEEKHELSPGARFAGPP
jgi:thiamine pyrophosphate-dependent acetolactate synthase large subunit-like protein